MSRNKSNNETKNRFINIHYAIGREDDCIVIDEDVSVTEEIYRAYKRPIWAAKKLRSARADALLVRIMEKLNVAPMTAPSVNTSAPVPTYLWKY